MQCVNVWMNVYVSNYGTNLKDVIFQFNPVLIKDNQYVPPSITVSDHDITISIERGAEIISQKEMWNDYNIHYYILMSDEFCSAFSWSWRGGNGRQSIAR